MDATLFSQVDDTALTLQRLVAAKVPFNLAHWFVTIGRNAAFLLPSEVDRVLRVRAMVRNAGV